MLCFLELDHLKSDPIVLRSAGRLVSCVTLIDKSEGNILSRSDLDCL